VTEIAAIFISRTSLCQSVLLHFAPLLPHFFLSAIGFTELHALWDTLLVLSSFSIFHFSLPLSTGPLSPTYLLWSFSLSISPSYSCFLITCYSQSYLFLPWALHSSAHLVFPLCSILMQIVLLFHFLPALPVLASRVPPLFFHLKQKGWLPILSFWSTISKFPFFSVSVFYLCLRSFPPDIRLTPGSSP